MERRKVPMILFGLAAVWIVVSVMVTIYIPDLQKPNWMQVADILAIVSALIIVFIELELRLRAAQTNEQIRKGSVLVEEVHKKMPERKRALLAVLAVFLLAVVATGVYINSNSEGEQETETTTTTTTTTTMTNTTTTTCTTG